MIDTSIRVGKSDNSFYRCMKIDYHLLLFTNKMDSASDNSIM